MAALAAFVLPCVKSSAFAETGATMIAIDNMMPGSPPARFTFATTGQGGKGEWKVVEDPTAAMGRAIEQSSTERTDYRFPLAIDDSFSAADLNVELRFKGRWRRDRSGRRHRGAARRCRQLLCGARQRARG
jgi:hypothetical protein